jgi:hypothetical protein
MCGILYRVSSEWLAGVIPEVPSLVIGDLALMALVITRYPHGAVLGAVQGSKTLWVIYLVYSYYPGTL